MAEEECRVPDVRRVGKTLACLVAREKETKAAFSTVVLRKSTGMAWLREIGLEFVDMIVRWDSEPALTSFIESWSNL